MKRTVILWTILAAICASAHVTSARPMVQKPQSEMDFEIVGGRIYLQASINGHPIRAVLDSGAGTTVIDLDLAAQLGLPTAGSLAVQGGGNATVGGKFLTKANIEFGGYSEPIPIAIPIHSLDGMEGRPIQAIIGYNFFKDHVLEIDYGKRRLRLFATEAGFKPAGTTLPARIEGGLCRVSATMKVGTESFPLETVIDTGASGSALTTRFVEAHSLQVDSTPVFQIGAGVGGVAKGRLFRPDAFVVADHTLARPIVAMTESGGGVVGNRSTFDFLLGAEILQRFVVTFDYAHKSVSLLPQSDADKPFEADKTGLQILSEGPNLNQFRVIGVLPGSTAELAGVKVGDVIEAVDGVPANKSALHELREKFKSRDAKQWKLGIRRDGKRFDVIVQSKSVI